MQKTKARLVGRDANISTLEICLPDQNWTGVLTWQLEIGFAHKQSMMGYGTGDRNQPATKTFKIPPSGYFFTPLTRIRKSTSEDLTAFEHLKKSSGKATNQNVLLAVLPSCQHRANKVPKKSEAISILSHSNGRFCRQTIIKRCIVHSSLKLWPFCLAERH